MPTATAKISFLGVKQNIANPTKLKFWGVKNPIERFSFLHFYGAQVKEVNNAKMSYQIL